MVGGPGGRSETARWRQCSARLAPASQPADGWVCARPSAPRPTPASPRRKDQRHAEVEAGVSVESAVLLQSNLQCPSPSIFSVLHRFERHATVAWPPSALCSVGICARNKPERREALHGPSGGSLGSPSNQQRQNSEIGTLLQRCRRAKIACKSHLFSEPSLLNGFGRQRQAEKRARWAGLLRAPTALASAALVVVAIWKPPRFSIHGCSLAAGKMGQLSLMEYISYRVYASR